MSEGWFDSNGPMGDVGAFMPSELRVDRADLAGHIRQLDGARNLIALAGNHAQDRQALARAVVAELNSRAAGSAIAVGVDELRSTDAVGFAKASTEAPEEVEIAALIAVLRALRAETNGAAAQADTTLAAPALQQTFVPAQTRFVLIEGAHLLSNRPLWRDLFPLFDLTVRLTDQRAEPTESRAADLVVIGA